jgi:hypothetical protein
LRTLGIPAVPHSQCVAENCVLLQENLAFVPLLLAAVVVLGLAIALLKKQDT